MATLTSSDTRQQASASRHWLRNASQNCAWRGMSGPAACLVSAANATPAGVGTSSNSQASDASSQAAPSAGISNRPISSPSSSSGRLSRNHSTFAITSAMVSSNRLTRAYHRTRSAGMLEPILSKYTEPCAEPRPADAGRSARYREESARPPSGEPALSPAGRDGPRPQAAVLRAPLHGRRALGGLRLVPHADPLRAQDRPQRRV